MSTPTPEQLAFEAFQASRAQRRPMMAVTAWTHPAVDEARDDWRAAVKAGAADVTAERDALLEQLSIARGALRDISASYDTGTAAHDWAHRALDEIGGVKPQPPREADALREQLADLRDQLDNLARGLELSASASAPSKKSEIERGCAAAVRGIAKPPS